VQRVLDRGPVDARLEPQPAHVRREAVEMRFEAEEAAVPDVYDIVRTVTSCNAKVEHRDTGFVDRAELAVDERRSPLPERPDVAHRHVM